MKNIAQSIKHSSNFKPKWIPNRDKMEPKGGLGGDRLSSAALGGLGALSRGVLGMSWAALGVSGLLWARSWGHLGRSYDDLGAILAAVGRTRRQNEEKIETTGDGKATW